MTETHPILVERRDDGIAIIRLNRPQALNALTVALIEALRGALAELDRDPACRVIVLAAEGRAFSAGLDLKIMDAAMGPVPGMALQELFGGTPGVMRRVRQPIVAAVQGVAVGAGFAISLGADIRIAGRSAKFMNGAIRIGLSAGETGLSYHLPRLVGAGRAFEIMLTGRTVPAAEALAIGLVTQVVDDAELLDTAIRTAALIAANNRYAVTKTKQLMWQNLEAVSLDAAVELENHVQGVAMQTRDFAEALQAFREKRPPQFRDE
jgi:enoyl-CoA hydratase